MYKGLVDSVVIPDSVVNLGEGATIPDGLRLKEIDKGGSMLMYVNDETDEVVTFRMNLLSDVEERQLDDFLSVVGADVGSAIDDAYNPISGVLGRIGESARDAVGLLIGFKSEETLADASQRECEYVTNLLRGATDQRPFVEDASQSAFREILRASDREERWRAAVAAAGSNVDKRAIVKVLYDFFVSNRDAEWRETLRTTLLTKMRERLLDDGDKSYLRFLRDSPELSAARAAFDARYDATMDHMMLDTIRAFALDAALSNYFDTAHPHHRVPYPNHQEVMRPTHRTVYDYATTEDTGHIGTTTELDSVTYRYVPPHMSVDSSRTGHQLLDKLAFAQGVFLSVTNLSKGFAGTALSTVLPLARREFKGFVDIESPEFANAVDFVANMPNGLAQEGLPQEGLPGGLPQEGLPGGLPQEGLPPKGLPEGLPPKGLPQESLPPRGLPPNGLPQEGLSPSGLPQEGLPKGVPTFADLNYQALAESSHFPHIQTLARTGTHLDLLDHPEFVRLFESVPLPHSVHISRNALVREPEAKYEGPALIEGRHVALFADVPMESDVATYLRYMGELAAQLLEKEVGFLATFRQVLKTVELSVEMLLTSVFTGAKIGLKWLAPLLSVPLIAASPVMLLVKYFVDAAIWNYASPKTLLFIVLELLVLPLEVLGKTLVSYGHVGAEALRFALVGVRENVRVLWNDAAKEVVAHLVRLDPGAPDGSSFLFALHTINGVPQYGVRTYHLSLETSTALVLSQLYTMRYEQERERLQKELDAYLAAANAIFGEKMDDIKTYLSEGFDLPVVGALEAYLGETVMVRASVQPQPNREPLMGEAPEHEAPAHEAFIAKYPYGVLALYPGRPELAESVRRALPEEVALRPSELTEAVHRLNVSLGSSKLAEHVREIVFDPNEVQRYDSFVTEGTNVSLRVPVTDLFVAEIVEAMEEALRLNTR